MKFRIGFLFLVGFIGSLGLVGCGESPAEWKGTVADGGGDGTDSGGATGGSSTGTDVDTGGTGGSVGTDVTSTDTSSHGTDSGTGDDTIGTDTSDTGSPDTSDTGTGEDTGTNETDSGSETESDTHANPCENGQHAACYGDEVWCHDSSNTPKAQLDVCENGEQCVVLSDDVSECQCVKDASQQCHNGDVWSFDSCGQFDSLVKDCVEPEVCSSTGGTTADCCEPKAKTQCGDDGYVHHFDSCGQQGTLAEICSTNADCQNVSKTEAGCFCRNKWTGENCEVCPDNWDTEKDCAECAGFWHGKGCSDCDGFGDMCQCPDSTFVPQPGVNRCWTCPLPGPSATNGRCSTMRKPADINGYNLAESCPDGFRPALAQELLSLFQGCEEDGPFIFCDNCDVSEPCGDMFAANTPNDVWTGEKCEDGFRQFSLKFGSWTPEGCDDLSAWGALVCVLENGDE